MKSSILHGAVFLAINLLSFTSAPPIPILNSLQQCSQGEREEI